MKINRRELRSLIESVLNEGEVVHMFSGSQKRQNSLQRIARALAARTEEMLDLDGGGDNIAVHVDHKLFLSPRQEGPFIDLPPLAAYIYEYYVSGKEGDQAELLDIIVKKIGIKYFDEDIKHMIEELGVDRFTMPRM